ncbi:MAG: hypothetical protein C5S41_05180 [Candidatus Methanomarinus sp.]|nr:MAG: hypothetical protein C5S41_05180 [ANME-2 cluster archaeon]
MENTEISINNTFSFIHTADLHLDSPFTGITRIDPKIGKKTYQINIPGIRDDH